MRADTMLVHATLPGRADIRAGWGGVAVRHGRIAAVGPQDALGCAAGRTIDLQGLVLRAAPHDAHTHLSAGAVEVTALDLRDAHGTGDVLDRVAARAASLPRHGWVRGFGWDPACVDPQEAGDRIAVASDGRPVFLARRDGHAAWIDARAAASLGLIPGTRIVAEADFDAARARLPVPTAQEREHAVARMLAFAAAAGLGTVEDVVEPWALPIYAQLAVKRLLGLRVRAWIGVEVDDGEAESWRDRFPPDDPWLAVSTRKVFLDGTLGGGTAARCGTCGAVGEAGATLRWETGALAARLDELDRNGWAVAFHAVGDAAFRQAIDAVSKLKPRARDRPHRIEHAQLVARADLERLGGLPLAVSIQPAHWLDDRRWLREHPPDSAETLAYPWRSLRIASEGRLALGSDWPVAPLDPSAAIEACAVREELGDPECLSPEEAWSAQTHGAALAAGIGRDRGVLAPGYRADLVAIDRGRIVRRFLDGTEV